MRIRSVIREALLDIRTGVTAAGTFAVLLGVAVGALAAADAVSVGNALRASVDFQRAGASTLIYDAPGRIDGLACEALAEVDGVRAAGAVAASAKVEPAALSGSRIPAFLVSGTFGGFTALGGASAADGVLVSADVADTLGVENGDRIPLRSGTLQVGGRYSYPDDGRAPGYGYAVLLPVPSDGHFDQCWVEVWPQSDEVERLLPLTVTEDTGDAAGAPAPSMHQLNGRLGARFDGLGRFDERITRFAPWAAATVAALLGFVSVRRRRLQLASARHAGVGLGPLLLQTALETSVWMAAGGAIAGEIVILVVQVTSPGAAAAALPIAMRTVAGAGACLTGAAFGAMTARESHLFAYFKQR